MPTSALKKKVYDRARTKLTYLYPEEYRRYYLYFKNGDSHPASSARAQGKAKNKLVTNHKVEYTEICAEITKIIEAENGNGEEKSEQSNTQSS